MKVRMKALQAFNRVLGGQMIVGDPNHPEEDGRILMVDASAAALLEKDGQAQPYSLKDQAREELEAEEGGDDDTGNRDGAQVAAGLPEGTEPAQRVRERRTKPGGNTVKGDVDTATKAAVKRAPRVGVETTATTNHPQTFVDGLGNVGDQGEPLGDDPDKAP